MVSAAYYPEGLCGVGLILRNPEVVMATEDLEFLDIFVVPMMQNTTWDH